MIFQWLSQITISKYHSWYLCQISLQIMLLPIQIPRVRPLTPYGQLFYAILNIASWCFQGFFSICLVVKVEKIISVKTQLMKLQKIHSWRFVLFLKAKRGQGRELGNYFFRVLLSPLKNPVFVFSLFSRRRLGTLPKCGEFVETECSSNTNLNVFAFW